MNIRQKLLLGGGLLALIPVVLTAGLMYYNSTTSATQSAAGVIEAELTAIRDTKRAQVLEEVDNRVKALQALAANQTTIEAFGELRKGYYNAATELGGKTAEEAKSKWRASVKDYVDKEFSAEYAKRNPNRPGDISAVINALDANQLALQNAFIVDNPNPLGKKDVLVTPTAQFTYGKAHGRIHPSLERAQKLFGFYDIFLIDIETDRVFYTVFKELDFTSSLSNGIAKDTTLAQAYKAVKQAKGPTEVYLSDFAPYFPSYEDQAAFAAVPVFENGRQVGVIAMQYPLDKITAEMSSNRAWAKIGLGQTGDTFIVGAQDKLMRTDARYMIENKTAFLNLLGDKLSPQNRALADKKNTTVGLVKIDSDATRGAAEGKDGFIRFTDYRGIDSLGAFGPLKVLGLNWVVVAKIDYAEAYKPVNDLSNTLRLGAIIVGLAVLTAALLGVFLFIRRFLKPIQTLSTTVQAVAGGNIDARSKLLEQDEIGDLGREFDKMLDDRIALLEKARQENETLNNSVINLLQTVFQLSNRDLTARAPVTEDVIGTVSSSINQFSDETSRVLNNVQLIANQVASSSENVRLQAAKVSQTSDIERQSLEQMSKTLQDASRMLAQVAVIAENSNKTAGEATTVTNTALASVDNTVRGMNAIRESISETEKRIKRLGERSQEISAVVSLINTISERTHVLALNASMQAAVAGEAGRGFAVVAEEVQRLSENARQATAQISQLVTNIQNETGEAISTVNRTISQVVSGSELAARAGDQMKQTQLITESLVDQVKKIAQAAQAQLQLAQQLRQRVDQLTIGAEATSQAIHTQTQQTETLVSFSQALNESVAVFKLPNAA